MDWYYLKDGRQFGPVQEGSIRAWLSSGFLGPDDLVWREGLADWVRAGEAPDLHTVGSPARPTAGPFGGRVPPPAGTSGYAGFWLRAAAYLIDSILLSIVLLIFWFPRIAQMTEPVDFQHLQQDTGLLVSSTLLSWFYFSILESSRLQGTLGKRLLHLKVVDLEGRRIGFGRSALRQLGRFLSVLVFYLGYVLAGVTPRKQALHDMLAGCLVVRD